MQISKISTLASRLNGIESLRKLFSALNFDYADAPVLKDHWSDNEIAACEDTKVVADKNGYKIVYVRLNTDKLSVWKSIANKIIKSHRGLCIVCSHNPTKFKWVVSIMSSRFSLTFNESRHVPIDVRPDKPVSPTFVKFLVKLEVSASTLPTDFSAQALEAYNLLGTSIQNELIYNVFDALRILSEGIITNPENHLELNDTSLHNIRESVFILIYRIMFVLYAEDRGIFQMTKTYYENYSIQWVKDNLILKDTKLDEYTIDLRLKNLFLLIEKGSEGVGHKPNEFFMRSYYGKLFDHDVHHLLDKFIIRNKNLLDAIRLLSCTEDRKGNRFFLDYAGLETRHLGEIYEHLMEQHLYIVNNRITQQSSLSDRKLTGSYYTPPDIVDYIVKTAIGPLVKEIAMDYPKPGDQIDHILELNILDPAMGSGHFLVGAVDYLAREIARIEYGNDVTDEILVERKRDVARRCIYGVDLNPLAVDIAQVSLWLETLSSDKPLSFLDAHIKHGNSLFGNMLDNLFETQTTLSESVNAQTRFKETIRAFTMLETLDDDTLQAVRAKAVKFADIRAKGTMYRSLKFLLDAKTAKYLDPSLPSVRRFFDTIADPNFDIEHEFGTAVPTNLSRKHALFHWDLEFPEVFYSTDGTQKPNPGFDVIVGNPPYFNLSKNDILNGYPEYSNISKGVKNVASYFVKRGCSLIRDGGYLSYIIPKSFLTVKSWKPIRNFVLKHALVDVHDVGKQWPNVALEQAIITLRKNSAPSTVSVISNFNKIDEIAQSVFIDRGSILTQANNDTMSLLRRIEENSAVRLASIATMQRGLTVHSSKYTTEKKDNFVRVLGGINIGRFFIKYGREKKSNRFLPQNSAEVVDKKNTFGPRRIIYQNIGSMITAAMVHDVPTDDTVNNLILQSSDYTYEGILALLNSELMDFYLKFALINKSKLTVHLDEPYLGLLPIVKPTNNITRSTATLLSNFDDINHAFAKFLSTTGDSNKLTFLKDAGLIDGCSLLSATFSKKPPIDIFQLFGNDPFFDTLQTFNDKITKLQFQLNRDIYHLYKLKRADIDLIQSLLSI